MFFDLIYMIYMCISRVQFAKSEIALAKSKQCEEIMMMMKTNDVMSKMSI